MVHRKEVLINLLPIDQESIVLRKLVGGGAFITLVLLVAIWLVNHYQTDQIASLQAEQTRLKVQVVNYKKQEAAAKQKKDLLEQLRQRQNEIKSAEQTGLPASIILAEIEKSIPRSVKIIGIQFEANKLTLNGFSPDQKNITILLSGLRKNSRFSRVTVTASKVIEENGEIEFVIESEWRESQ